MQVASGEHGRPARTFDVKLRLGCAAAILSLAFCPAAWSCEAPEREPDRDALEAASPLIGTARRQRIVHVAERTADARLKIKQATDFEVTSGAAMMAVAAGRVVLARAVEPYGNTVVVDHGSGLHTLYGRLGHIDVREGDCVAAHTLLGRASLGAGPPWLRFELSDDGRFHHPLPLPGSGP